MAKFTLWQRWRPCLVRGAVPAWDASAGVCRNAPGQAGTHLVGVTVDRVRKGRCQQWRRPILVSHWLPWQAVPAWSGFDCWPVIAGKSRGV